MNPLSPEFQPEVHDPTLSEPRVILWRIAIFMTTFLFIGSPNVVCGIIIQGNGMIGSAIYLRKSGAVRCTAGS